jgi:uncharacterized protein YoxC
MQIYWIIVAAIVPALAVAIIYRSRLQKMMENTVSQGDFKRVSKTSSKQEHDLQVLSTQNLELQGEVQKLRTKITGMPARLDEYKAKLQDSIRVADGLGEEMRIATEKQRQATEALSLAEQQLVHVRMTQDASEKARDQLKIDLKKSNLRAENLQLKLGEEQHQSHARLEEASKAMREEQHCRRDVLAELLFLQHHFGEAGIVARRHWQSADPHVFTKEPFEHEADVAMSTEQDSSHLNGECCDHLPAKDDREPLASNV